MTEEKDYFEEHAAIIEYDGGLTKAAEERQAKYETKGKSAGYCK